MAIEDLDQTQSAPVPQAMFVMLLLRCGDTWFSVLNWTTSTIKLDDSCYH